jgi:iron complex outermembrane receptor protein
MKTKTAGLFLAMAVSAVAATYSGTVKDTQGKPVADATVTLYSAASTAGSATTDSTGTYRLEDLPESNYLLRITAPGFAPYVGPQQPAVVLDIAKVREQVVVTAQGTPQAPEQVSRAIDVIDRGESEARNSNALSDALNITAGLRVQQLGGPGGYSTIQIRGLRAQDTAVLVDGMRLRDASATQADASGLVEDLLVTNASQIEVMRGSGSSLYGTDAIGGVVNIITDEGGGRTRGSLLLQGGSLGTEHMNARLAGGLWKDRIDYSFGIAQTDVTAGLGGDAPFRDISTLGRMTFRLAPSVRLIARLYSADSFSKVRGAVDILGTVSGLGIINAVPGVNFQAASDNPDYTRAARMIDAALILKGQATPAVDYSLSYQLVSSSRRFSDGPAGIDRQPTGSTRSIYDGHIQTATAQASYRLGRANLLSGGYEFENEIYAYDTSQKNNAAVAAASNVTERSQSIFVQDQAHLFGDRLQLSAAVRMQHFALDDPSFLPLASAPYRQSTFPSPTPAYTFDTSAAYTARETGTKFRAHIGRGYRAPSLFERFGAGFDPVFGYSVYGDPRLQPERSLGLDAGFEQTFFHNRVKASASYFYTWLSNVIAFNSSGAVNAATDLGTKRPGGWQHTSDVRCASQPVFIPRHRAGHVAAHVHARYSGFNQLSRSTLWRTHANLPLRWDSQSERRYQLSASNKGISRDSFLRSRRKHLRPDILRKWISYPRPHRARRIAIRVLRSSPVR